LCYSQPHSQTIQPWSLKNNQNLIFNQHQNQSTGLSPLMKNANVEQTPVKAQPWSSFTKVNYIFFIYLILM